MSRFSGKTALVTGAVGGIGAAIVCMLRGAGEAFGANRVTILFFVERPLAFRSIMAGVNHCITMSLSIVIIPSMIGAGGLGDETTRSISPLLDGRGVEAGLGVVVLPIPIDRFTRRIAQMIDPTA